MEVKKNPKFDLGRKSILFFQLGLIVMLSLSWVLIEYKTEIKDTIAEVVDVGNDLEMDISITDIPDVTPPPPPQVTDEITLVDDVEEIEETVIESTELDSDAVIEEIVKIEDIDETDEEEIITVPFTVIEDVPTYPGCENERSNEDKKLCMSDKITELVQKQFNSGLSMDLGLEGIQRIFVQFRINEKGVVSNIKARAPHPMLEDEAVRVIKLLPKMSPGKQRGKPVGVIYTLPIVFKVQN